MTFALALVGLILGIIVLVQSKGTNLLAWAVSALALSLAWPVSRIFQ